MMERKKRGEKNTKEKIHVLYLLNFKGVMEGGKKDGDKNGHMLIEWRHHGLKENEVEGDYRLKSGDFGMAGVTENK